ncbi:MAG: DUF192 domain-containing protein [Elusimicrobiota bacterium]
MALINVTRGFAIAQQVRVAGGFFERIRGLLGQPPLEAGEALIIPSVCPQVHTFFLGYTIDVVFLNSEGIVVGLETVRPWRWSKIYPKANRVVELIEGTIKRSKTQLGDRIENRGG